MNVLVIEKGATWLPDGGYRPYEIVEESEWLERNEAMAQARSRIAQLEHIYAGGIYRVAEYERKVTYV